MTRTSRKRRGVSWELTGIIAIVAVFLVGFLIYATKKEGASGEVQAPTYQALGEGVASGVTDDGRPYMGAQDATATIFEFADFQCPHCRDFSQIQADEIKKDYVATGKAKLVWVNFPILGSDSEEAARGAFCALDQGAPLFWSYHDWLFANQPTANNSGRFSHDGLVAIVAEIEGMDSQRFADCLEAQETIDRLQKDRDLGNKASVESTPSFLIGDTLVAGGDVKGIRTALDGSSG